MTGHVHRRLRKPDVRVGNPVVPRFHLLDKPLSGASVNDLGRNWRTGLSLFGCNRQVAAGRVRNRSDSTVRPKPRRVMSQTVRSLPGHSRQVNIFPSSLSSKVCPLALKRLPLPWR